MERLFLLTEQLEPISPENKILTQDDRYKSCTLITTVLTNATLQLEKQQLSIKMNTMKNLSSYLKYLTFSNNNKKKRAPKTRTRT